MDSFPENAMIGLEVHMQLRTGKLFCRCGTEGKENGLSIIRDLKTTSGEAGIVDESAMTEESKKRRNLYLVTDNSCLLELDEQPPKTMSNEALSVAMAMAKSFNSSILDRISVMRKIVIDGSNTGGFQRTSIISFGGEIRGRNAISEISTICLEEDSCRKIEEKENTVTYSLERLGIPLIEISTKPDMKTPEEAMEIAKEIGNRIIVMGMLRKGADSIRQDVNFSMGYGRVEIKGVSKLSEIRDILLKEANRQKALHDAVENWKAMGGFGKIQFIRQDSIIETWNSKMVSRAIEDGNGVYISPLLNGKGFLKNGSYTIGREIADALKLIGINGIIHYDELPAYGLSAEDRDHIHGKVCKNERDSFLILLVRPGMEKNAGSLITQRLEKLFSLNFSETRAAFEDGTTRYMRPISGSGRMYPETDIPIIKTESVILDESGLTIPDSLENTVKQLSASTGLSMQDSESIIMKGLLPLFRKLSSMFEGKVISRILLQKIPEMEKKYGKTIPEDVLFELVKISSDRNYGRYSLEWAMEMMSCGKYSMEEILEGDLMKPLDEAEMKNYVKGAPPEERKNLKLLLKNMQDRYGRPIDMGILTEVLSSMKS